MTRNIIICSDGTGNTFGDRVSNVTHQLSAECKARLQANGDEELALLGDLMRFSVLDLFDAEGRQIPIWKLPRHVAAAIKGIRPTKHGTVLEFRDTVHPAEVRLKVFGRLPRADARGLGEGRGDGHRAAHGRVSAAAPFDPDDVFTRRPLDEPVRLGEADHPVHRGSAFSLALRRRRRGRPSRHPSLHGLIGVV